MSVSKLKSYFRVFALTVGVSVPFILASCGNSGLSMFKPPKIHNPNDLKFEDIPDELAAGVGVREAHFLEVKAVGEPGPPLLDLRGLAPAETGHSVIRIKERLDDCGAQPLAASAYCNNSHRYQLPRLDNLKLLVAILSTILILRG